MKTTRLKEFLNTAGESIVMVTLLLWGTLLVSSCNEDLEDGFDNDVAYIDIMVTDKMSIAMTRADYAGLTTTFEDGDEIGLYAVDGTTAKYSNVKYTLTDGKWVSAEKVPYNDDYTYYAYYPFVLIPTGYTPNFSQFNQTVDAKFYNFLKDPSNKFHKADQSTKENYQASDLMIAEGEKTGSKTVSFAMLHKKGLAVFDGDGAAGASFTGNIPYLMGTTKYFLMKPSTSTSFTDDEETYSLSASSGKYVTHNIEGWTYILNVTDPPALTQKSSNLNFYVTSYRQNSAGTRSEAVAWTATFDTDGDGVFNDSKPSWITTIPTTGAGGTTAETKTIIVKAAQSSSVSGVTSSSVLQSATEVTDYDLSLHNIAGEVCAMTTANCYLVHAPGTYKLPLVYGNAIKNGSPNIEAYNPSGSNSDTFLTPFLNHAGNGITDPWLKNNNATPDGASLVWQDVNGMISAVGISGDYLTFTVDKSKIAEGNAVIAATKSGTVVWSWHIWVTPEALITRAYVFGYYVAAVNLGWVNSGTIDWSGWEGRSCTVKISQSRGRSETFALCHGEIIKNVTASKQGYNTYYQWGRKDPEIPAVAYNSTTNHAAYNISGSSVSMALRTYTSAGTSAYYGTIANGIKYPLYHYYNNISGNSGRYGPFQSWQYNLWDANNTATGQIMTKTVKTIYDPCPAGFCIPTSDLWYEMSGGGSSSDSEWDDSNKGRLLTNIIPNVYFPASGLRKAVDGSLANVGRYGFYWSASPNSSSTCHDLDFYESNLFWDDSNRAFGMPVRPVKDQ